jgi:opacity protein-like surface antigen
VKNRILLVGFASTLATGLMAVAAASPAQAALAFNQNLAAPGVYYGTGNLNGDFTVDTESGVEVGLRAHIYQQNPTDPVGDLYTFALGNVLSFDYSVNPDVGESQISLASVTALLTITDLANGVVRSFDPSLAVLGNATNAGAPGGYQNSERLSFGFVDPSYNSNQNNTFNVNLTLSNVPAAGTISVTELIQQGSGFAVPEPSSWALMILGLGGVGAGLRRTRKVSVAATA